MRYMNTFKLLKTCDALKVRWPNRNTTRDDCITHHNNHSLYNQTPIGHSSFHSPPVESLCIIFINQNLQINVACHCHCTSVLHDLAVLCLLGLSVLELRAFWQVGLFVNDTFIADDVDVKATTQSPTPKEGWYP